MTKIINFVLGNEVELFLIGSLALIVIFLIIVLLKKKLPIIPFILTFVALGLYFSYKFIKPLKGKVVFKKPLVVWIALYYLVVIIISYLYVLVHYLKLKKYNKLLKLASNSLDDNVYAFLNRNGKLISLTNNFKELFVKDRKESNWKKHISKFEVNQQTYSFKQVKKFVSKNLDDLILDVFPINKDKIRLKFIKIPIMKNDKLVGFILKTNGTEKRPSSNVSQDVSVWFDILNDALMYFDYNSNKYILTKPMAKLLKQETIQISNDHFTSLILSEDLSVFNKREFNSEKTNKYIFRLKTINGIEWFENITYKVNNTYYDVIRRANLSSFKFKFLTNNNLIEDLKVLYQNNDNFSLAIVSLNSVLKFSQTDRDLAEVLVSKYFNKLNETTLRGKYRVYRLGNIEYAIVIINQDDYNTLLRNINSNSSDFLSLDVFVNEVKFTIENSLGLVQAYNVDEKTPDALIKAGLEALYLATDPNYKMNYSIYIKNKDKDYRFEDLKIDLSDKFLDEII